MTQHQEELNQSEPRIETFDYHRVIGLKYVGKNEKEEIKDLWGAKGNLFERIPELHPEPGMDAAYGICRCIPDKKDGTFEYIAAIAVTPDSSVPEGMAESFVSKGTYLVFPTTLAELMKSWQAAQGWLASNPEWEAFCDGVSKCDCANHPCFEYYPSDFGQKGVLYLYMPVKKKS